MRNMPHKGVSTRLLSPEIWGDLPIELWQCGVGGWFLFDDFKNVPLLGADQDIRKYASYIDTGVTIQQAADDADGALKISHDGTDNDEGIITTGGNTGGLTKIDASSIKELAFECRLKKSSIADNVIAFFIGLSEEGLAAADTLVDDTGELADKDFIGFRVKHDNGEELDFVYEKSGQTIQEVIANIQAMAADTYLKMGFRMSPSFPDSRRIKIFVGGGNEEATYVTQTNLEAATFPDGEELAMTLATKLGSATASSLEVDWWACGGSEN